MDTRKFLTTLAIMVLVYFLLTPILNRWWGNPQAAATATTLPYTPVTAALTPAAAGATVQQITLGDARGKMDKVSITVDTVTAGIDDIELNIHDYAEDVEKKDPLTLLKADPRGPRPYATIGLHVIPVVNGVDQEELDLTGRFGKLSPETRPAEELKKRAADITAGNTYALENQNFVWGIVPGSQTANSVQMQLVINGYVEVIKTFKIDPLTYEVAISHTVKNLSDQALKVSIDQLGSTDLPRDNPQYDDRMYYLGQLNTAKKAVVGALDGQTHLSVAKYAGGTHDMGLFTGTTPGVWVSSGNRFFETVTRPEPTAGAKFTLAGGQEIPLQDHVASVSIDLLAEPTAANDPSSAVSGERLVGLLNVVPAGGTVNLPMTVYAGPKKRDLLAGDPTAPAGSLPYLYSALEYGKTINYSYGSCAICTFEPLAKIILQFMDILYASIAFHNYGVAIMILVILVRAILHPLTRASQINMATMGKKMKAIQPKLEAAKKRYAGDSKKVQEETMRIYRENEVNPAGPILGCLPMLLQTPIWAALYSGLNADIDLRHAVFIPGWINDLSNPDRVWPLHAAAPLFTLPVLGSVYGLNLLPILMLVVYYFNMKFTTASTPVPTDANQKQMQAMSKYMIFLLPIFLYNRASGLNLYILMSTIGGLIDTWFIRKTLKKRGILPNSAEGVQVPNPLV